jgi:hypothetical protein
MGCGSLMAELRGFSIVGLGVRIEAAFLLLEGGGKSQLGSAYMQSARDLWLLVYGTKEIEP